jgi:hypothetical protein
MRAGRVTRPALAACAAALVAFGPSCGPAGPPRYPGYGARLCKARCQSRARCRPKHVEADCFEKCTPEKASEHVYDREIYVRELERCLSNRICGVASDCEKEVRAHLDVSDTVRAFCGRKAEKDRACGIASQLDECIAEHEVLVDGVFPLLSDCFSSECDQYLRCMVGVFVNPPR